MTKEHFFELLDYYFRNVNSYDYKEIREEYEDRFKEGEAQGIGEEEIIEKLGSPKKIFEQAKEEGRVYPGRKDAQNFIDQMTDGMNEFFSTLRQSFFKGDKERKHNGEGKELKDYEIEFDADVMRMDIRYVDANVFISEEDRDKIKISYRSSSDRDTMNVGVEGRILKVETSDFAKTLRREGESVDELKISIPKDSSLGLNILGVSGNVHCESSREEVSISTVSGDIHWDKKGEQILEGRLKTVSGKINVHAPHGELYIKTVSGNVEILEENQKIMDIATTSGSTTIRTDSKNYHFKANTISGNIFVMEDFKNKSKKIGRNYEEILGTGDLKIQIRSISGDQLLLRKE